VVYLVREEHMKKQQPISAAVGAMVAGVVLGSGGTLLANGGAFFIPAARGPVDLVYFARIKDAQTGRPIQKPPYVTIVDPFTGIYIPFQGDGPGHFRSPDIGTAIKEVSSTPIDTGQLEIVVSAAGYQTVKVRNIPRRAKGTVELNVRMEPKANAGNAGASPSIAVVSQPGAAGGGSSAPTDSARPTFFLLATCFGLAAISAVVRTVGRPGSTGR
jgi:hypothetical protein